MEVQMSTSRSTWKRRERDAAGMFGARRQPLSGSCGRSDQTKSDSTHDRLYVECKYRAASAVRSLWERTNAEAKKEGKTPVLLLFGKGRAGGLVVVHERDLAAVAAELAVAPGPGPVPSEADGPREDVAGAEGETERSLD
jgi:hypothetical protein